MTSYKIVLSTGSSDEIEIGASSFQINRSVGQNSYLSVVVPWTEYDIVVARLDNNITIIQNSDGFETELITLPMSGAPITAEGADSRSLTIQGRGEETESATEVELAMVSSRTSSELGALTFTVPYLVNGIPGATVTHALGDYDDTFVLGRVSINVNANETITSLVEAEAGPDDDIEIAYPPFTYSAACYTDQPRTREMTLTEPLSLRVSIDFIPGIWWVATFYSGTGADKVNLSGVINMGVPYETGELPPGDYTVSCGSSCSSYGACEVTVDVI